jgi:hypothetical protein
MIYFTKAMKEFLKLHREFDFKLILTEQDSKVLNVFELVIYSYFCLFNVYKLNKLHIEICFGRNGKR